MAYSNKVVDHYENPRNVGSLPKDDVNVGTGLVGAPECGAVLTLQVKANAETRSQARNADAWPGSGIRDPRSKHVASGSEKHVGSGFSRTRLRKTRRVRLQPDQGNDDSDFRHRREEDQIADGQAGHQRRRSSC